MSESGKDAFVAVEVADLRASIDLMSRASKAHFLGFAVAAVLGAITLIIGVEAGGASLLLWCLPFVLFAGIEMYRWLRADRRLEALQGQLDRLLEDGE